MLTSQCHWSLFNGTWQKRPRELVHRLFFEQEEMTLQMQTAVLNETTQLNEMTQQLPFFAKENPHQKLEQIHTVDAVEADWYFSKVSVLLSGIVHLLAV